jgi:hypothetical protein
MTRLEGSSPGNVLRHVRHILLNSRVEDIERHAKLEDLVWATFESFKECYQTFLERNKLERVLPTYLLARPLIGIASGEHDPGSPLFTVDTDLAKVTRHLHIFRQYVGLSSRLRDVSGGMEGAISRRLLSAADPDHFCYSFVCADTNTERSEDGVKSFCLANPEGFARLVRSLEEGNQVAWSPYSLTKAAQLSDSNLNKNEEARYADICTAVPDDVFGSLGQPDRSFPLVSWWLHEATRANLLIFRGFDETQQTIDRAHPWGGVWFLVEDAVPPEQIQALALLVHECFNLASIELRARDAGRALEWRRDAERFNVVKDSLDNFARAMDTATKEAAAIREALNLTGSGYLYLHSDPAVAALFKGNVALLKGGTSVHDESDMTAAIWGNYRKHLSECAAASNPLLRKLASYNAPDDHHARLAFRLLKWLIQRPDAEPKQINAIQLAGMCWVMINSEVTRVSCSLTVRDATEPLPQFERLIEHEWNIQPDDEASRAAINCDAIRLMDALTLLVTSALGPRAEEADKVQVARLTIADGDSWIELRIDCRNHFHDLHNAIRPTGSTAYRSLRSCISILAASVGQDEPRIWHSETVESLPDTDTRRDFSIIPTMNGVESVTVFRLRFPK